MSSEALEAVEALERRLRGQLTRELQARWRHHAAGVEPAVTRDVAVSAGDFHRMQTAAAGARSPALARRAEMMARMCAVTVADLGARDGEPGEVMIDRRNRAARELGFADYWAMWLSVDELEEADLAAWLEPSPPPAEPALRNGRSTTAGAVIEAARSLARSAALRVDFVDGGSDRTYLIDPPRDVRVVCRRARSARGLRALAHELGHAVYGACHAAELPWSLADAPSRWMHEAVAEHVADRLVGREGVEPGYRTWVQLCAAFERAAYVERPGDLDALWVRAHRRYARRDPARSWRDVDHFRIDPGPRYLAAEAARVALGVRFAGGDGAGLRSMMALGASRPAANTLAGD